MDKCSQCGYVEVGEIKRITNLMNRYIVVLPDGKTEEVTMNSDDKTITNEAGKKFIRKDVYLESLKAKASAVEAGIVKKPIVPSIGNPNV